MKRFTETEKWRDPWFRKLTARQKCLWIYMLDSCDHAGVIDLDWDLAAFQIGGEVKESDLSAFTKQVVKLPSGKFWMPGFVAFQYGRLSRECKPHLPVFAALERHGIDVSAVALNNPKAIEGYPIGFESLQDKEKDKDKDKETEKDTDPTLPFPSPEFAAAWADYVKHRSELRKPLKPTGAKGALAKLVAMGEQRAIAAIRHSIANGWQGIFEPDGNNAPQERSRFANAF